MSKGFSRRSFLKVGAATLALPYLIPASALGRAGRPSPSARVNLGFIGYGTQGRYNASNFMNDDRVQAVAVCDCNKESKLYGYDSGLEGGREYGRRTVNACYAKQTGKADYNGCTAHNDFRELLDKPDVDAVMICTPDHWHAAMAIAAMRKGKHVYCQKPLSLSIAEGRAMATVAKETGVTFQTGSQQRSDTYFKMAVEFIRNNRLGKIHKVEIGLPKAWHKFYGRKGPLASFEPCPVPEGLDYELWTGPSPMRPYCSALQPLSWRSNYDFAGGVLTDWGAHHSDIVQWAFDKELSGPTSIENIKAGFLPPPGDVFNVAKEFSYDFVYPEGTRVTVSTDVEIGIRFYGEKNTSLFVSRGTISTDPAELIREKIKENEIHVYASRAHERNLIDCIYSGQPTIAPCETGHRSNTIGALAVIGLRLGRSAITWDPAAEKIIGDDAASAMLSRKMRQPWVV